MMFTWEPEMIRFMQDASEYGDYQKVLTDIVMQNISPDSNVCDAGCGIGYLSLELSKHVKKVTAVDINSDALMVLRNNCEKLGITNIDVICDNLFEMIPEKPYDAMVFCYCGKLNEILRTAKRQCNGPVFIFKRNNKHHSFSVSDIPYDGDGYSETCKALVKMNIPFKTFETENDFGQPFKDISDAHLFYETYSHDKNKDVITDNFIRERLIPTGRSDFPWYLSNKKRVGCIMIDSENIPVSKLEKK